MAFKKHPAVSGKSPRIAAMSKRSTTKISSKATQQRKSPITSGSSPNGAMSAGSTNKVSKKVANRTTLFNRLKDVPMFKG